MSFPPVLSPQLKRTRSSEDSPDFLQTMKQHLENNKLQFIASFSEFDQDRQQEIVSFLFEKSNPIKGLAATFKSLTHQKFTDTERETYISRLFQAIESEHHERIVQSHLHQSDPSALGTQLYWIKDPAIAKLYLKHIEKDRNNLDSILAAKNPPTILFSTRDKSVIEKIKLLYPNFSPKEKASFFRQTDAETKVDLLNIEETPKNVAALLTALFPLLGTDYQSTLRGFIVFFPNLEELFAFLEAIKQPEIFSAISYQLMSIGRKDFLLLLEGEETTFENSQAMNRVLTSVDPTPQVVSALNQDTKQNLLLTTPLLVGNYDSTQPPSLSTLLAEFPDIESNEELSVLNHQQALQQVPCIIIASTYSDPQLRQFLSPYFKYFSDEQMQSVARTLPKRDMEQFLKETKEFFDRYYEALPRDTLLDITNELQTYLNLGDLHSLAQEVREKYEHLRPTFERLNSSQSANWEKYRTGYQDLANVKSRFTKQLSETIFHLGRYTRIMNHLNPKRSDVDPMQPLHALQNEFCYTTSPTYLDTSQIRPPYDEKEKESD